MPVSGIACTRPASNMDRALAAKRIFRDAREERQLSRQQMARMQNHADDRLVRAWEDEDAANHTPLAALLPEEVPDEFVESVFEKIRKARGQREALGANSPLEALCAVQRDGAQFMTWMATAGIALGVSAKTASQCVMLLEKLQRSIAVALRFMRRVTGAHAAAKGGRP